MFAKPQFRLFRLLTFFAFLILTFSSRAAMAVPVVTITAGPAPSSITADPTSTFLITVHVDNSGAAPDTTPVTLNLLQADGATPAPSGTTLTPAIGQVSGGVGNASFPNLKINKAGTYKITATSLGVTSTASGQITVTPGAANQVVFSAPPVNGTAGHAMTVTVQVQDVNGNDVADPGVPVTLSVNPADFVNPSPPPATIGTLGPTTTGTFGDVSFTFTIDNADTSSSHSLTASAAGLTGTLPATFKIAPDVPNSVSLPAPSPTARTTDQLFSTTVIVKDQYGNLVADGTPATLALTQPTTPPGAILAGTTSATTTSGTASFGSLNINKPGTYTLTATSAPAPAAAGTTSITISAGAPASVSITQQPPASASAGNAFSLKARVTDADGNTVTDGTAVTLTLLNPSGTAVANGVTLTGASGVTTSNGVATFNALRINKTGSYILQVTSGVSTDFVDTSAIAITADVPASVAITQQPPASISADNTFTLQATVMDAGSNSVTDGTPVTLALNGTPTAGGTATLVGGSATTSGGIASFTLNVNKVGTYTLTATSGGISSADSSPVAIVAGALHTVTISPQPATTPATAPTTVSADNTFSAGVTATDAEGNPITTPTTFTLALVAPDTATLSDASASPATMPPSATSTTGTAFFGSLNINKTGTHALVATATANAVTVTSAASNSITVTPGAVASVVISQQPPSTVPAGTMFRLGAAATDAEGNGVNGRPVTLTMKTDTGVDATGKLVGTKTVTTTSGGVATFADMDITSTGNYIITATADGKTADSNLVAVTSSSTTLRFTPVPTIPPQAGTSFSATLILLDSTGNPIPGQPVTLTLTDSTGASVPFITTSANPQITPASGTVTFNLSITQANTTSPSASSINPYTLTATGGGQTASDAGITIRPGPAAPAGFAFTGPNPSTTSADGTFSLGIAIADAYGNPVIDGTTVTPVLSHADGSALTSGTSLTDASGTAPIAPSATTSAGRAAFSKLNINKIGTYVLAAQTGTGLSAITSARPSSSVTITPGAPHVTITQQPTPTSVTADAASTFALSVTVQDAEGNPVTDGTPVTLALLKADGVTPIADMNIILSGASGVKTVSGAANFSALNINIAGSYTLQVKVAGATPVVSDLVTVGTGTVSGVAITGGPTPTSVTADPSSLFSLTVTVKDRQGNPAPDGTPVTLALTNADGTSVAAGTRLSGASGISTVGGVATFSSLNSALLSINKVGSYVLTATAGAVPSAPSTPVVVTTGILKLITITQQPTTDPTKPATFAAGAPITPSVLVKVTDNEGNPALDNTTVTLALTNADNTAAAAGTILSGASGTTTGGVATFSSLNINKVGTYLLTATSLVTATNSVISSSPSNPIQVTTSATTKISFSVQPTVFTAGNYANPAVNVLLTDANGNTLAGIPIVLSLTKGGGTLSGTLTQNTSSAGIATFSDLKISQAGANDQLTATGGGSSVASNSFTVNNPALGGLTLAPASVPVGSGDISVIITGTGFVQPTDANSPTTGSTVTYTTQAGLIRTLAAIVTDSAHITVNVPGGINAISDPIPGTSLIAISSSATITVNNPAPAASIATATFAVTPLGPVVSTRVTPLGPVVSAHYGGGLQMLSTPFDYSVFVDKATGVPLFPDAVLESLNPTDFSLVSSGIKLAVWDPAAKDSNGNSTGGAYILLTGITAEKLVIGKGYWGRFPDPATGAEVALGRRGVPATTDVNGRFSIPLSPGWNMIGNPFAGTVKMNDLLVQPITTSMGVQVGGTPTDLKTASDNAVLSFTFYKYGVTQAAPNTLTYLPVTPASITPPAPINTLDPYLGYWVLAYQPCTLLVPSP